MPAARKREGRSNTSGMGSLAERALRRQKKEMQKTKEIEKRDNSSVNQSHRRTTQSQESPRFYEKATSKKWFQGYFED
jgi:hypothetical protein